MATALITPAIIEWARDRRELTDTRLATSVHVSAEKIRQWTAGQEKPTIRQAQLLARALKIPFGYLYLDNPPKEDPLIPDLRTIATRRERSLSPDFLDLVRSLQRKQDWYRDFLVSEGAAPLPFVESYSPNDDPQKVAESMRTIWGLDVHSGAKVGSWSAHIKFLCDLAESHGILILRSGVVGNNTRLKLDVTEFRGLALSDKVAPIVFVNSTDAKAAQVFTIAHELAHIWIGRSAVSDVIPTVSFDNDIEEFCNKVAAEFLVPESDFRRVWRQPTDSTIQSLARRYRVSTIVITRRALELDLINRTIFFGLLESIQDSKVTKSENPGGNFQHSFVAKNSETLINAVFSSVMSGSTLYRDAAAILDLKLPTLVRLVNEKTASV